MAWSPEVCNGEPTVEVSSLKFTEPNQMPAIGHALGEARIFKRRKKNTASETLGDFFQRVYYLLGKVGHKNKW